MSTSDDQDRRGRKHHGLQLENPGESARYALGDFPVQRLNAREKFDGSEKPNR